MNWPLGKKETVWTLGVALVAIYLANYTGIARRVLG